MLTLLCNLSIILLASKVYYFIIIIILFCSSLFKTSSRFFLLNAFVKSIKRTGGDTLLLLYNLPDNKHCVNCRTVFRETLINVV